MLCYLDIVTDRDRGAYDGAVEWRIAARERLCGLCLLHPPWRERIFLALCQQVAPTGLWSRVLGEGGRYASLWRGDNLGNPKGITFHLAEMCLR